MKKKIKGLIAPVFTPMKENGDINVNVIPQYAEKMKSNGLKGVFALGSSGEGMLLTTDERKTITEAWAPYASEEFKLIVHVGSTSYREAQELAKSAYACGAWAISCMGPTFLQPKTTKELVEYCRLIASATPDLPFYYYHIPVRSGIAINMLEFLKEGSKLIPNLAGIKFTHSNFMEMQQCISFNNGEFDITHGQDESLLCGLALGVQGAIGTTYNFVPNLYKKIIHSFNTGDLKTARELQRKSVEILEIIIKYRGGIVAGKAMMKMSGIDCGPCRSPLMTLSSSEEVEMKNDLEAINFFKYLSV